MRQKVFRFMQEKQVLKKGSTILIGVSGGPDSIALLHLYHQLREKWDLHLIALSVDHQLRGEASRADVAFVESICQEWKIPFQSTMVDVDKYKQEKKVGTQVAARELRYAFFKEQCQTHQADYLALGHHGDDQVETMLMNFTRSSNPVALAGIPLTRSFFGSEIIRPLLCVNKQEILTYLKREKIHYRIDASNEELDYTRNYFRQMILPLFKERNQHIHMQAQQLSEHLFQDEAYLQMEANKVIEQAVLRKEKAKKIELKVPEFKKYSPALQRRAYHLILSYLYCNLPENLSMTHEKSFFELLDKSGYKSLDFPQGLVIEKSYDLVQLSFKNPVEQNAFYQEITQVPSQIKLENGATVKFEYVKTLEAANYTTLYLQADQVSFPLVIRYRQTGDRMSWPGLTGSKKLKDIFIDEKIPLNQRNSWPILVDRKDRILWLVGLKKGNNLDRQTDDSELYIKVTYEHLGV